MTKPAIAQLRAFRHSVFGFLSSFVIQRPDEFFTAEQQARLNELMARWRAARDSGAVLPPAERAELDALVEAEVRAVSRRTVALLRELE